MTNTQNVQSKIDIAKEYVALHKEFDVPHKGEDSGFESSAGIVETGCDSLE